MLSDHDLRARYLSSRLHVREANLAELNLLGSPAAKNVLPWLRHGCTLNLMHPKF